MAVRATMAPLIARVRLLISDSPPPGTPPVFFDQDIQDVLDEGRVDVFNMPLVPKETFSGATILYLDYETDLGGWEDGYTLRQFLTQTVTPSVLEPIAGHWSFAASTFPPVFITGRLYDVYRAAADLLERWAAKWVLRYSATVDGQGLQRSQVTRNLQLLAVTYRKKQRAGVISMRRSDLNAGGQSVQSRLAETELDRMASG